MARITLVVALMAALVVTLFTTAHGETLTEGSGDRALLSLTEVNEGRELLAVGGIRAAEAPTYFGRKMLYNYVGTRAAEAPFAGSAEAPAYGRKMLAVGGIRAAYAPAPSAYKDAAVSTGIYP